MRNKVLLTTLSVFLTLGLVGVAQAHKKDNDRRTHKACKTVEKGKKKAACHVCVTRKKKHHFHPKAPQGLRMKMVRYYKAMSSYDKNAMSFEIVETATRLVNGLLLEKSLAKLKGDIREKRQNLSGEYNIDSVAIAEGNMIRLRAKSRTAELISS